MVVSYLLLEFTSFVVTFVLCVYIAVTPDKRVDDLGVATPPLVIMKAKDQVMAVEGEGFMGQYTPLSKANLEQKLYLE